jgi:hypothetical protein
MNADDLLNRLLYAFTALALIWAFATSESFVANLAMVGDAIRAAF